MQGCSQVTELLYSLLQWPFWHLIVLTFQSPLARLSNWCKDTKNITHKTPTCYQDLDGCESNMIPTWLAQWGSNVCSNPLWHTKPTLPFLCSPSSHPTLMAHKRVWTPCSTALSGSWASSQGVWAGLGELLMWTSVPPAVFLWPFSDPFPGRRYWECGTCSFLRG